MKVKLYLNFPQYADKEDSVELDNDIIENREMLSLYPKAKKVYEDACSLFKFGIYERNLIDNLRLTLELICRQILSNERVLENNVNDICSFLKNKNCSQEFINMFHKLLDYYLKYNNNNVKHNENINADEVTFVFGLTNLFIRLLVNQ
ncbi:MAG: hypothetical protein NC181_02340 [Clostridium sp.]|nr:hypothetical protein [Clostridium sp.]MCM1443723.1 hypothetical protein [Candidatus Amulumruptor caecigallinarius]